MSRRQRTNKPMAEINVVPYIDVMLVLLIIFMVTAPLLVRNVDVDLPVTRGSASQVAEDLPPVLVGVDAELFDHRREAGTVQLVLELAEPVLELVEPFLGAFPDPRRGIRSSVLRGVNL